MIKSHYRDVARNQDIHWWYVGMAEINKSLLNRYLPKKDKLKILDAGCGPGAMLIHLKEYGDVMGVDMSEEALKYAKKRGRVKKGDITSLDFKEGTFDLVICMDVLYHMWVDNESKALGEFKRVLKRGGVLLLREPAFEWLRGNEDRGSLTARRFSKGILKSKLEENLFDVKKISYANFFLLPMVVLVRTVTNLKARKGKSDMVVPTQPVNMFLISLLKLESKLMKFVDFPVGSSIVSISKKV